MAAIGQQHSREQALVYIMSLAHGMIDRELGLIGRLLRGCLDCGIEPETS